MEKLRNQVAGTRNQSESIETWNVETRYNPTIQHTAATIAKARQLIELPRSWKRWATADREPIANWVFGRATLLGDAAHPTTQYMAQGACMAMEDAVCLADSLGRNEGAIEPGLALYRDRRVLRTARVQLTSRAMGDHVYHPDGPHAALRNAIMSGKSQAEWLDVLEWIYGGNGLD